MRRQRICQTGIRGISTSCMDDERGTILILESELVWTSCFRTSYFVLCLCRHIGIDDALQIVDWSRFIQIHRNAHCIRREPNRRHADGTQRKRDVEFQKLSRNTVPCPEYLSLVWLRA